jgi:tRNA (guanine37-N1)-methyltransferase
MRFDLITLFVELFDPFLRCGVTRRAYESRQVDVRLHDLREHAEGQYRRVDDRPFGGGPGMVMMAEPLSRCLAQVQSQREADGMPRAPVLLFSPVGRRIDQATVQRFAEDPCGAVLLCGRYEGIDQRFIDRHVDEQLSLGDFVLSGGAA